MKGLRLDEAMNDLALLVTGLYGAPLPAQDGAPIRLVVPWKYGFKGIKAIVKIELVADQPNYILAGYRCTRIWFLCQRKSQCASSTLVAGGGAAHRRVVHASDTDVQWLRR